MESDLRCGDALQLLPSLPAGSVDCVITDPPYGIDLVSHGGRFRHAKRIANDTTPHLAEAVYGMCADRGWPLAMFFSPYRFVGAWRNVLVWNKGKHVGIGGDKDTCWKRDFELIGVAFNKPLNGQRDSAVLRFNALSPPPSGHVAEKPVPLMRYLVEKLTQPGDTVLDPCMGSGTTGVACALTGRRFIGFELDRNYYEIALKRIAAVTEEGPLFKTQPSLLDGGGDGS